MARSESPAETSGSKTTSPRGRRRWGLNVCLAMLLTIGVSSAAAFHFLKPRPASRPIVEYEKPDEAQAAAKEEAAKVQKEDDRQTLQTAQAAMKTAQAEWESAKLAKDQAEQNREAASLGDLTQAKQTLADAEAQFAQATAKRDEAQTQLKAAEDKLKTADQLLAEAEAERERVAKHLAQAEVHHKALLGKWTRPDAYGQFRLDLKDDGTGLMEIEFNTATKFLVRSSKLDIDIEWKIANGNHVIFDSLRGRPENAFKLVTELKGTHRDEVLIQIDENSFTTHDADNKSKVKSWTRLRAE